MKNFLIIFVLFLLSCSKPEYFKEVILTFDDAPYAPENTKIILDVLEQHNVHATFFCVGEPLLAEHELATRISKNHILANHSYNHIKFSDYNLSDIYDLQITRTQEIIDSINISNGKPINRYFRAPYSGITNEQIDSIQSNGFKVIWWELSAEEWDPNVKVDYVYSYITNGVRNTEGIPIVLFHLGENTIDALKLILEEFERTNVRVVSLKKRY